MTELEFEAALEAELTLHAFFLRFVFDTRNGIERDAEAMDALEAFRSRVSAHCVPVDCVDHEDGRSGWEVFSDSITALAANPPPKPGGQAPGTLSAQRIYTPAELEDWVQHHQPRLAAAFAETLLVSQREVHVPLEVEFLPSGSGHAPPALLQPADLVPLVTDGPARVLLISGDGGAGKTSLAFAIARWLIKGEPGGVVRLPVLIETSLEEGQCVAQKARSWLADQLSKPPEFGLVEAMLRERRLVPILDHVSELSPAARQRLLAGLPPGLVIATSRSPDDGWKGRALSRIVPQPIALDRLQSFFVDYLKGRGQGDMLRDDELVPAQNQLRRIVGDKPITALLAQIFIDDVIANRQKGLLAGSVPQLMLSYVQRLDTPADPAQRERGELLIDGAQVQRTLKRLALASHRQAGSDGEPAYQPQAFSRALAKTTLQNKEPEGLNLSAVAADELLSYLIDLRLLVHPASDTGELRFPLDPLADYLAALAEVEALEALGWSIGQSEAWETFLKAMEQRERPSKDLSRAKGFYLALRDVVLERGRGVPVDVADRLAELGGLNAEKERERLAEQRARKWMWELLVPHPNERRDAISKLAVMAASTEPEDRRAVSVVACDRLTQVLVNSDLPEKERKEAAVVLGLIGTETGTEALEGLASNGGQPPELRRAALEALGLVARDLPIGEDSKLRSRIETFLEHQLGTFALDMQVQGEDGWAEHDQHLPILQGASRGLQLAASTNLPLLDSGPGRPVPMLTLTAINLDNGLRIRTEVVSPHVWQVPLPNGEQLEMVLIPGGEYKIGSPESEAGRDSYAKEREDCKEGVNVEAQRTVILENFMMVRHPITQSQWAAVAGMEHYDDSLKIVPGQARPIEFWDRHVMPLGLPVETVSWEACQNWLTRLNLWLAAQWKHDDGSGRAPQLELPSESQWEIACRAGSSHPFHFGDVLDASWAKFNDEYVYGRARKGNSSQRTVGIGSFGLANRYGLTDMHGQLWEWCEDAWHPDLAREVSAADGISLENSKQAPNAEAPREKGLKLLRGGSWFDNAQYCRAAYRFCALQGTGYNRVGFRPCCSTSLRHRVDC